MGPELLAGQACFPFAVLVAQNLLSLGFICPGTFSYPTTFGLYDFNILISLYNSDSKFEDFDKKKPEFLISPHNIPTTHWPFPLFYRSCRVTRKY